MKIYPNSFPVPLIDGYHYEIDCGILRPDIVSVIATQRRRYKTMAHHYQLVFAVELNLLEHWQLWVNTFGYNWFSMRLTNSAGKCAPQGVRFVSDLALTPLTGNVFVASIIAESIPREPV